MRVLRLAALASLTLIIACTKTTNPTVTAIQAAVCTAQTDAAAAIAKSLAGTLACSNVAQIQADILVAYGNANLCKYLPAASVNSVAGVASPKGPIGNVVCPLATTAVIGFLTNSIPTTWGCATSAAASAVQSAIISACELAVPI